MTEPAIDLPVKTDSEHVILVGENLPNHSTTLAGLGKFVRISPQSNNTVPICRTRQSAYRLAANLLANCQDLPHEDPPSTWDDVLGAVLDATHMELDSDLELEEE